MNDDDNLRRICSAEAATFTIRRVLADFYALMCSKKKGEERPPRGQYSIYGDHAVRVMPSVLRVSPRNRWPDRGKLRVVASVDIALGAGAVSEQKKFWFRVNRAIQLIATWGGLRRFDLPPL